MIMPFRHYKLNQFYLSNIKDFLYNCDLQIAVKRSDDFVGTDIIVDTILEQIQKAEFIICDITHCNKNVFFEIGYAKALSKDIIFLLEQQLSSDFFDVNHIRRIEYGYEQPTEFRELLRATLLNIRSKRH